MTSDLGRLSADNAALVGIMGELVVTASRTSASYEHEIDVLRAALRRLLNAVSHEGSGMDYCDFSPQMKEDRDEWHLARGAAIAAIERTDWKTP